MTDARRERGQQGERMAEQYLIQKGLRLQERNFRTARGEIDLILWDKEVLVFVEVRTRSSLKYGSAIESITWQKQKKLREMALAYLQTRQEPIRQFRFDVVGIQYGRSEGRLEGQTNHSPAITHIVHAFS
ncbi:YraN family protein [Brevibacillus ruminantium]|uniref:UPF0102 protein NDK47_10935 n=1 Tax=Brevibacillus ruminantium TaxID=2950604 RepID=A0ABY4WKR3_9BACL|nr:YraN family protein [Brevibacillus ruminantium]USG67753.1 YraN family protein [Brevibacillus ruminantium]